MADVSTKENDNTKTVFSIKNVTKATNEEQNKNENQILRDIIKAEDVTVFRKDDEGKKSLFDRPDIKVNHVKTEIDYSNVPPRKDINFNNPKQKTSSETVRTISGLTEEMLEDLFEDQGEKSSLELVEEYLDQLIERKDVVKASQTENKKRSRSLSCHSSDESVLKYYRKNKNSKRSRKSSRESFYMTPKIKRSESYASKRFSRKRNRNSITPSRKRNRSFTSSSDESDVTYKDKSYDSDTGSKKSYRCSCRKCMNKEKYNQPSTSNNRYSKKSKYEEYSAYKKKNDKILKYHRYNAAMFAVSIILEIIKKDFRSKNNDEYSDSNDEDVEYHRCNAAMYAIRVILEIIRD